MFMIWLVQMVIVLTIFVQLINIKNIKPCEASYENSQGLKGNFTKVKLFKDNCSDSGYQSSFDRMMQDLQHC